MTAPRYRRASGYAGVDIELVLEGVGERGGVPFVHQEQHHQEQAHRHRLGPEERRDVARDGGRAEQHEADILPQPAAQRQQDFLALAVLHPEGLGPARPPQQPEQLNRTRKKLKLPNHIVPVYPSPAQATSNAPPGHHSPAWARRYIRWKYRLTNRRLSLMPSSARPKWVGVP